MGDNSPTNDVVMNVKGDATKKCDDSVEDCVPLLQKLVTEVIGTFFLIFTGCAAVVTNLNNDTIVTLPGVATVWGLSVMVLAYSTGHISGAHFNPAVTIAHASTKRLPLMQAPLYILSQVLGSTLASGALRLMFSGNQNQFTGTVPAGSDLQAFVVEFIITFYLMFIITGVATDSRAIGELAGLAVGSTVLLNVLYAGPVTGASMNPARSLGPAIVHNKYTAIWVYLVAPTLGALAGTWVYTFIRYTNKPVREITKSASFIKGQCSSQCTMGSTGELHKVLTIQESFDKLGSSSYEAMPEIFDKRRPNSSTQLGPILRQVLRQRVGRNARSSS